MRTTICILLATVMFASTSNADQKRTERAIKFISEFNASVTSLVDELEKVGLPLPNIEIPGADTNKLSRMKFRSYMSGEMSSYDMGIFEMHFKNRFASVEAIARPKITARQRAYAQQQNF